MKSATSIVQEAEKHEKASMEIAKGYFGAVLGALMIESGAERLEDTKGRAVPIKSVLNFMEQPMLTNFQWRVLCAMRRLNAESAPLDILSIFGRMERGINEKTSYQLAIMTNRINSGQSALYWLMMGYEFYSCACMIAVLKQYSHLPAVTEMLASLFAAVCGFEDRVAVFEGCAQYCEQFMLGMPFGMEASQLLLNHTERLKKFKHGF